MNRILGNRIILFSLIGTCAFYTAYLYVSELSVNQKLSEKAIQGQDLWQQNNCSACHQIYGLGGYLGPDLTNVYSNKRKGPRYIKAFLNSGVKSMPKFNFTEEEKEKLVEFLKCVDQTGNFPNRNAHIEYTGLVNDSYQNE